MRKSTLAVIGGPCLAAVIYSVLPAEYSSADGTIVPLSLAARGVLAMSAWMAWWWLSEAIPVAATALIPIAVFPILGLNSIKAVCVSYAHPLIFLFFGGFLLSLAIQKWSLHAWTAGHVVRCAAGEPRRLVAGFMLVSAFASMWLSNTATAIMMLPIAVSLIARHDQARGPGAQADNFARCLLLSVAYAASIGGTATLIGSPPNLFVASYLNEHGGPNLDFRTWMLAAAPVVVLLLPLTWWALTRLIAPIGRGVGGLAVEAEVMPTWRGLSPAARRVALIFVVTVLAWLMRGMINNAELGSWRPFAGVTDTGIAMLAGLSLFVLPAGVKHERLLDWPDVQQLPFGTLLLFGGGLALAATLRDSGADQFIGARLTALHGVPAWVLVLSIVALVVMLTELTSNTATTTTLAPILAAAAVGLGQQPAGLLIVTALAASCAFMMPVATPPNAIVFSSGRITVAEMAVAGLLINVLAIAVISAVAWWWLPLVLTPAGSP